MGLRRASAWNIACVKHRRGELSTCVVQVGTGADVQRNGGRINMAACFAFCEMMKEYRAALIAVTGQIDVRGEEDEHACATSRLSGKPWASG